MQTKGEDLTSCADNDIELLNCSIDKFNTFGQNLFNWRGDKIALTNGSYVKQQSRKQVYTIRYLRRGPQDNQAQVLDDDNR